MGVNSGGIDMQLTEAQVKQAIGDLYLDNWKAMQALAALVQQVHELNAAVEALKDQVKSSTPPSETE